MKKKVITLATVAFVLATTSIVFYSCKKSNETIKNNETKIDLSTTNVVYPIFPSNDKINDHLRHLAFGSASLLDLIYLSGNNTSQYISEVEARIVKEEAPFETIKNNIDETIFKNGIVGVL